MYYVNDRKGVTEYTLCFLTMAGLLRVRARKNPLEPEHPGPIYRVHILNPLIFCVVSGFIVVRSAYNHLIQALFIFGFYLCGIFLYKSTWWQRIVIQGDDPPD